MISININKDYTFKFSTVAKNHPIDVTMETEDVSKVTMTDGKTYYVRDLYTINSSQDFAKVTDIFYGKIFLNRRYIVKVENVKVVEIKENDLENVNHYKKEYEKYITYSFYEMPTAVNAEIDLSISNIAEDGNSNEIKPFKTIVDKKHA